MKRLLLSCLLLVVPFGVFCTTPNLAELNEYYKGKVISSQLITKYGEKGFIWDREKKEFSEKEVSEKSVKLDETTAQNNSNILTNLWNGAMYLPRKIGNGAKSAYNGVVALPGKTWDATKGAYNWVKEDSLDAAKENWGKLAAGAATTAGLAGGSFYLYKSGKGAQALEYAKPYVQAGIKKAGEYYGDLKAGLGAFVAAAKTKLGK